MARTKTQTPAATMTATATTDILPEQVADVPATPASKRGRKRKADVLVVPSVTENLVDVQADNTEAAADAVTKAPPKKRAKKADKTPASPSAVESSSSGDAAESSASSSSGDAAKPKTKTKREFVFMELKDGVYQNTTFHYTQKRSGEAEQAGSKALTRHLKRLNQNKTSEPIALREKDTNNMYFYEGDVVPLETPKKIERAGAEPYMVTHKTNCRVPEGSKNPQKLNNLGRGKGFTLVVAQ